MPDPPATAPSTLIQRWRDWLPQKLEGLRLAEHRVFLALTIIIGLVSGLSAVLFLLAVHSMQLAIFGLEPSALRLILAPTLFSVVAGFLLHRYFRDARGSGVPQVEAAFHLNEGVIPARTPFGKFLTGALCIGSGHSLGREGPSVQIGAGLASALGRWLRLSPANVKNLVPVGSAAALAAAFNTPIAAVLFALEEIVGDMNAAVLGSTVLASVVSVVLTRSILGNAPLFAAPTYALLHPAELLAYAALGLVGGVVSVAFCKGLLKLRAAFQRLPAWTVPWQPAMGGLMLGLVLVAVPQVMGGGYEFVDQALHSRLLLGGLLVLAAAKFVCTIISYASGNAGGIFAPTLFLGAMVGGATGVLMRDFAPFATGDPGAYALVGMGTLFAGIIRTPMTSVFMIFELTQDYEIVVPLMVANMTSYMISRHYQKVPVYHALLQQEGIHLPLAEERVKVGRWRVRDVMNREPHALTLDSTVAEGWDRVMQCGWQCFPVLNGENFVGVVTRDTLAKKLGEGGEKLLMREIELWRGPTHVHPDHSLELALERLTATPGLLPVVSRQDIRRLEGVLGLEEVLKAMAYGQRALLVT